ncbi:MAG TPA: PRC-barrel domain-containing protein [Sphingomicrobium sp.]|jgi:sporulation protein YlmC with PRC-barrel domain|nr:PRC-barrel domain-containing protein [Sphingomicrobium sp.]
MRLSDLRDKRVRTLDGDTLGRVHEVHCDNGRVTALMIGPGSLVERLVARRSGRRVPWECVRKVEAHEILVTPDPPQRIVKPRSGPRNRRRTPPASGRRSTR